MGFTELELDLMYETAKQKRASLKILTDRQVVLTKGKSELWVEVGVNEIVYLSDRTDEDLANERMMKNIVELQNELKKWEA